MGKTLKALADILDGKWQNQDKDVHKWTGTGAEGGTERLEEGNRGLVRPEVGTRGRNTLSYISQSMWQV